MDTQRKKELRQEYAARHPEMGIVCWKCGDRMWIARSRDAKADYNSSLFQLQLGSWPNWEMQAAFKAAPDSFEWILLKSLDYKELSDDHTDDLELLYMETMEEHPDAMPMKAGKR